MYNTISSHLIRKTKPQKRKTNIFIHFVECSSEMQTYILILQYNFIIVMSKKLAHCAHSILIHEEPILAKFFANPET